MKNFMLGVNYWASHAGADMWRDWQEETVENDLKLLAENGVKILRVFPNWRDFQPVEPAFGAMHHFREYRMAQDAYPANPYYLDEKMLEHFHRLCQMAAEHGIRLIVGLITGWMSGRLYVPPVLYGKNIYTDPTSLFFQQRFIKGFVSSMKEEESICAWDLGNECNCMDQADSREEACNWTELIVNAVRACDQTRPVISGMHSLELEGTWNIQDQGELTDMLTTHPYPYWVEHCQVTPLQDFRTLLHATAQTQYYASIGGKPCLVEELGSMGPMVCSEERAADFLKVNLWSNWAHGATGVLWWCAHDQSELTAPPYDWNMCERELGMMTVDKQPKPTLLALKEFTKTCEELQLDLPYRRTDGVCILSKGQDHWGIAYMSYILAKQAGLTLDFAYCEQELPDSDLYFLPSACMEVMSKRSYDSLKQKIQAGATLYVSSRDGIFTEFEELTGLKVEYTSKSEETGSVNWENQQILCWKPHQRRVTAVRATVLLEDEQKNPLFSTASYGKGRVYFLNFPMEEMLLTKESGLEQVYYRFYETAAKEVLEGRGIHCRDPYIGMTLHEGAEADYVVLINYTDRERVLELSVEQSYQKRNVLYGESGRIGPFGTTVIQFCK